MRTFAIIVDEDKNKYIEVRKGKLYANVEDEYLLLTDAVFDEPIFTPDMLVDLTNEDVKTIEEPITSTMMIGIVNLLLGEIALSGKLKYINGEISISKIEKIMLPDFIDAPDDDNDRLPDKYYYDDRLELSKMRSRIREWASIFTVSRSEVSAMPPPGLNKFKKELLKKMEDKYGDALWSDQIHAFEFEKELLAFDQEYLKDGTSEGITLSKKIKNNSRKDKHLSIGFKKNNFDPTQNGKMITKTLSDGISMKRDEFPFYANDLREGSIFRGVQTQKSGSIAKDLVMATMGLKYVDGDCGTKEYRLFEVDDGEKYVGMFHFVGTSTVKIEKASDITGKTIKLRRPRFCKSNVSEFCYKCSGDASINNETGIVLQSTLFGGTLVNLDMKKMHGSGNETVTIEF
jgi:hypothetical protein